MSNTWDFISSLLNVFFLIAALEFEEIDYRKVPASSKMSTNVLDMPNNHESSDTIDGTESNGNSIQNRMHTLLPTSKTADTNRGKEKIIFICLFFIFFVFYPKINITCFVIYIYSSSSLPSICAWFV